MKLIEKIIKKRFNPKCGLGSIGVNTFSTSGSGGFTGTSPTLVAFLPKSKTLSDASSVSNFSEIEEIHLRNNKDAKDLIINMNGIVTIEDGMANEQFEAIRVTYSPLALDLSIIIKIYSFTSGDKAIFAKNSQKNKLIDILNSNNISIDVIDLVDFK